MAWGAAAFVALLVLVWFYPRQGNPAIREPSPSSESGSPMAMTPQLRFGGQSPAAISKQQILSTSPVTAAAPIIDDITIEKPEVCEGEENLIHVEAHTPDGSDAHLHYVIGGGHGHTVPLKAYLLPDGRPMHQTITVFGRNGISTTMNVPFYRVDACRPERTLTIGFGARANTVDHLEFAAAVLERGRVSADQFRAVRYEWKFGDGTASVTSEGFVAHSYAHRKQDRMYSQYLVEVRAFNQAGASVLGRTSIQFLNLAFQDLEKFGVVTLSGEATPRFPVLSADGVVRQTFEIWHYYWESVEIQRIRLLRLDTEGLRHDDGETFDLSLLSHTDIPVGGSLDAELSFDTLKSAGVLALIYRFEGISAEGKSVIGEFPVMRPLPVPTRSNSVLVQDASGRDRIRRALNLLGKDTVSQEELWQLEREGRLEPRKDGP